MKVILAEHLGMCFGVRDAIDLTEEVANPESVTIHGELVHNLTVLDRLSDRGFHMSPEDSREDVPTSPAVLITAHGVSNAERRRLAEAGKTFIDSTCPLVHRAHDAALAFARAGYFVIVLGKAEHVEVRGLVGDLDDYAVIMGLDEVRTFERARIGIICQTTFPPRDVDVLVDAIRRENPDAEVIVEDTICQPTRQRQDAVDSLLARIDALVVVGSPNSNNTRQLGLLAESHGVPWRRVARACELDHSWLESFETVGLTAGTSTTDDAIREVHGSLLAAADSELPVGSES